MKLVRIGIVLGVILSGVFVTFYGGSIPYRLFYFFLAIPLLCFFYTLYVYLRFKVFQSVGHKTLVKEEAAEYTVQVGNEDFITYENMKLIFYEDYSVIQDVKNFCEYCLMPGEKKEYKTTVLCKYRGNYPIGVKAVQVTDFLHLFHITYPIYETCKVSVLPKIVDLGACFFLEENIDEKRVSTGISLEQPERDVETRPFQNGDDKRMVNWKVSAKYQELLIRKWTGVSKREVTLLMETLSYDQEDPIAFEDRMLECILAITYYCVKQNTLCHVVYEQEELRQQDIYDYVSFDTFYQSTSTIFFRGKLPMEQVIANYPLLENQVAVILTATVTDSLLEAVGEMVSENIKAVILVLGEKASEQKPVVAGAEFLFLGEGVDLRRALEEGDVV